MQDRHQLWVIASAPDNIPMVAMLFLVPFFTWLGIKQALANEKFKNVIDQDAADGTALNIQATPTFYVNGTQLTGGFSYPALRDAIEAQLGKK